MADFEEFRPEGLEKVGAKFVSSFDWSSWNNH